MKSTSNTQKIAKCTELSRKTKSGKENLARQETSSEKYVC